MPVCVYGMGLEHAKISLHIVSSRSTHLLNMVELLKHMYIEPSCEHCMLDKYLNLWTKCGICSQLEAVGSHGDFFRGADLFGCFFFP